MESIDRNMSLFMIM